MRALSTQEIESFEDRDPPPRSPWWWRLGLVALALGGWWAWRTAAGAAPAAAITRFEVLEGLEALVVLLDGPAPAVAHLEIRPSGDDQPAEATTRLEGEGARTRHRFLVRLPPGGSFYLKGVLGDADTLERKVHAPPPLRVRLAPGNLAVGAPGEVAVTSSPPLRGRLLLALPSRELAVPLSGEHGDERGRLPTPAPGDLVTEVRYQGVGHDGVRVDRRLPLLWGGAGGAARYLLEAAQEARRTFRGTLLEPSTDFDAAGIPVSQGAYRRPPPEDFYRAVAPYLEAEAWVARDIAGLLQAARPRQAEGHLLYGNLALLGLIDAAFRRDGGRPPQALMAGAWARLLAPAVVDPPPAGAGLLPPGDWTLFPEGSGLPGSFFAGAVTRIPLRLPAIDPGKDYRLTVVGPALEVDSYFEVDLGGRRHFLGPASQPGAPEVGPGRRAYALRLPGSWVGPPAALRVNCIEGSFFPAAIPAHAVHLVEAGP